MKWRFMAALMGLALLVLLVQDIPLSGYLREVETDRIITSLERDAFVLAGRSEESLESSNAESDAMLTETARMYRDSGGARVVIVNVDGVAVVTSDDDQSRVGDSYLSRPEIATALGGAIASGHRYSQTLKIELLYVTVPVLSGDEVLGAVRLTYPEQVVTDAVNSQLGVLGLVALTTVLLAGFVGYIFASGVTRRLKQLRLATERIAGGDLQARADENGGAPELRSLSRSFNGMAVRLDALIEQQRTFAADASHQLRTPLTALKLRLERARELLETDPAAAADRLADAEAETDRLATIIEGLLLLSRSEASTVPAVPIDLGLVATERVEHWLPLAQELGVGIRVEGAAVAGGTAGAVVVRAIPTAVEQIIDNYIDNALSVSPAGSELIVRVVGARGTDGAHADGGAELHVLDSGPGLSAEDCASAFERFWRADSDTRGSGLGLAIVAQLAAASRAHAKLAPRPDGGLDASVTFSADA